MSLLKSSGGVDMRATLRKRVVDLYRQMCRNVPNMIQIYGLGQTPHEIRHIIGLKFRKHSHVRDPRIIEMLIAKGEMEMEETMMQWSQRGHVVDMLDLNRHNVLSEQQKKSVVDDQWWISAMLETLESQNFGDEKIDENKARKIVDQAQNTALGDVPGQQLAPAGGPQMERYYQQQRTGENQFLDQFLTGTERDNPTSENSRMTNHTIPDDLKQLRERNERGKATREQLRQGLLQEAADRQQGEGPFIRPPKSTENKDLPLWMATKIHYPWVDPSIDHNDPRVKAFTEQAKDELEHEYKEQQADDRFGERMIEDQKSQMADAYRFGRAY